ncbi:(2,3-dihydroxybenzoyl)adenylate synthase [Paracoccus methylarcula]|uniref:3-methylmercaptopropionyl-CoA ligase n=1 Tax=Paracoccus methylarcula TaxID=72022 RepID=A0A422R151_9RHOB|nr:AMP-binding protein [Paracoccus methylarcula]RNF35942.1 2,3-dihydroxybenzoate-AMP ligase [Paracoccus methylarcula]
MSQTPPDWQSLCPFWPAATAQGYRAAGIWQAETFFDVLDGLVAAHGDRLAVIDGARRLGYAELRNRALALAHGLRVLGLRRGDRVIVQLPNCAEFVELCFALFRLGVVPVLALPAHRDLEIGQFAAFSEAKACFIPATVEGFDMVAMARRVQKATASMRHVIVLGEGFEALYQPDGPADWEGPVAEDVACFQISGGTTGIPKLIPRRHMEYIYNVRCAAKVSGFTQATRYLCALPMSHNFPMACPGFLGALMSGGCVVIAPNPSPDTCFALIAEHGVTVTALVPPLAVLWLETAREPLSLELLQVGGAKINPATARRIGPELGCRLQQVLGMAEGLICYTRLDDPEQRIIHTQGRPMSEYDEVRVVRSDGVEAAPGETGELQTRGPYTIRGYFNRPDVDADAFTADGFYRSGDIVSRDSDGYLTVEGRDKDQINCGGEKIGVDEVEDLLLYHPSVVDAAVVARPDDRMGERACAIVIPRDPRPSALSLRRHLRDAGLAGFKIPDEVIFVDAFPQTGVGKVNKRQLREMLQRQHFGGDVPA